MNIAAANPRIEVSHVPLETLAHNANVSDADKVAEVARQFEAVLLRQILQNIRKPILAKAEGDPTANGVYDDMINNQMADNITRAGGFGLAKSLTAQLSHQVLPHPTALQEKVSPPPVQKALIKKQIRPSFHD